MIKICIVAGEKSGDLLGSKILKSFKKEIENNEFKFIGLGGELMEQYNFKSLFDIKELAVMGIFEVVKNAKNLLNRIEQVVDFILKEQPDILLTIDSPDFSFRVAKKIKELDINNKIKKIHLIAPSVWVYRKNRAQKIAKIYDLLFCILPFEPPYFEKYNLKTKFIGHPIFDSNSIEYTFNKPNYNHKYNFESNIISLTTGSRNSEINIILPILMDTIKLIKLKYDNFIFKFLSTAEMKEKINFYIEKYEKTHNIQFNIEVIDEQNKKFNTIEQSKLIIAKSGTNLLEIAGFNAPMLVIYRFNFLTTLVANIMQKINKIRFVSLLNILNKTEISPEVLLLNCTAKNIFNKFEKIINDKKHLENQIKYNIKAIEELGYNQNNNSSEKIKQEIMELLNYEKK